MTNITLVDSTLESLTPGVNIPLAWVILLKYTSPPMTSSVVKFATFVFRRMGWLGLPLALQMEFVLVVFFLF
jgi:hypothetical protein